MKNLNTILLVFAGILYLSACEAKCRGKNVAKLKRSLKLAISSDDINNRHKAGLRKIFRRKRDTKDEDVTESDKFTAEIKFLQKWNPAMSKKDGSAYRLFQGNVLDAVLEQLNSDRRFIKSYVLDLKKTSDGILAKVGFHFKKSEHNPISHMRFVVSQGHLSSLKVDKHYFKVLKTAANFPNEDDKEKTSTQLMTSHNPTVPKQEPNQKSAAKQEHNESLSAAAINQIQAQPEKQLPNTDQTQPQNEVLPQAVTQSQASPQNQGTSGQYQEQATISSTQAQQSEYPQDQNTAQVTTQQQTQALDQAPNQNPVQGQDNAQVLENQYPTNQPQKQYVTEPPTQQQTNTQNRDEHQTTAQSNAQLTQNTLNPSTNVNGDQAQPNPKPAQNVPPPAQVSSKQENGKNMESTSLEQNGDAYQTAVQSTNAQGDQTQTNVLSEQKDQKNKETASFTKNDVEEKVAIKMNQAWFPFLSNHDSPQYKMLAGNLEKGLKSVMEDDTNIKDIKVKSLLQADEGHTTVEFLLKFNGDKKSSTEKLRKIVKTGDIAGISVDGSFFKIEDDKKAEARK